ncbi:histidinol-phosphate aminotransferase [Actinomycetota bacterium]|nr:histidinol-phosphate aminotransferase [Actinomycetota bacterium]
MTQIAIRDDILGLTPYQSFDQRIKARLNTNENPYPISDELAAKIGVAVEEAVKNANRYPSDEHTELKVDLLNYIKEREGVEYGIDNILAANGSNEIMQEVHSAFGGPTISGRASELGDRAVLTFTPTYSMYPQYARDSFTKYETAPRIEEDYSIDVDLAIKEMERIKPTIVEIANPNNPTGGFTQLEDIVRILDASQEINVNGSEHNARPVVVVDEAYIDFKRDSDQTALPLVAKYDNLLVVRTLSKAFSFAGVRCGFAVGSKQLIDALKIVRLPYNLSTITQTVVRIALKHSSQMLKAVDEIRESRDDLYNWLNECSYQGVKLHVIPSAANFIQVGFKNQDSGTIPAIMYDYLVQRDVQVRVVGPEGYFRVTIGTPEENQAFKDAFEEFLSA